jgi:uncharacterized protein YukE
MADEISVDTDAMMNAAPYISDLAGRVQNVYGTLTSRLAEAGPPWPDGEDDTGETFHQNYDGPKENLLTGLSGTSEALNSTYDGVVTMAKGFAATEAENQGAIHVGSGSGYESGDDGHSGSGRAPRD